jgi:putative ABC transport system ATP-binding protein
MRPLIEFTNTYFTVSQRDIIRNLNLAVFPGDFLIILGGNGSGKSSLLKLINQTNAHTQGHLIVKQQEVVTITQFIANSLFLELTIAENALLIARAFDPSIRKKNLLGTLASYLQHFNPALATMLSNPVKNLSGGEQQVLAFALYLIHHPKVLLLDEHTSALDPKKAHHVMALTHEIAQEKKITCLMTTHNLDYALRYGNRLLALREGEIVFEAADHEKKQLTHQDLLKFCY